MVQYLKQKAFMSYADLLNWKNQGLNLNEISSLTGKSKDNIYRQYRYHGIEPILQPKINPWNLAKIYDQNDPDGLYVIGLLAADGYLNSKRNGVCIWIQEQDIELLFRIRSVLNNEAASINRRELPNRKPQVNLNIGSVEFVSYLGQVYGFTNNKSRELPFPNHLHNPLPFLRGFMDGDGHIGHGCTFTCGSKNFVDGLLNWVFQRYGYVPNVQMVGLNKNSYNVNFRKKHAEFIRDLFSYPGLARKTEAYLRFLPN